MDNTTQNKKITCVEKYNSVMHSWIIPILHMVLWGGALIFAQCADVWLGDFQDYMDIIQFSVVFVVFFMEILIVLGDIYVSYNTDFFKPRFVIFSILFNGLILVTGVSTACAVLTEVVYNQMGNWLWIIIIVSSVLKLAENLLQNNKEHLIVTCESLCDIGVETYKERNLNSDNI